MCAIAGFCNLPKSWEENIRKMNDAQADRGPDNEGIWCSKDLNVVLGHRRLSIIDLTENGSQPMVSLNDRYVMSFNGEVYNFDEIRRLLESNGCYETAERRFTSDTRILLEAYSVFGIERTLDLIRGMYAIALYDKKEQKLYLMRDITGEKPLYYGSISGGFVFASTINAIQSYSDFRGKLSYNALNLYFREGFIPCPYSVYEGICKLEPGTILSYDVKSKNYEIKKYWDIDSIAKNRFIFDGSYDEAKAELHKVLSSSVKRQMVADVPVGVMLSSGIDSSTVTSLMTEVGKSKVKTFSIGFESDSLRNEAPYAKKIAKHLGADHTELYLKDEDVLDAVPLMTEIYGEPFADASQIPTYLVSALAKTKVKVALTGDGADELFCGYPYYSKCENGWDKIRRIPTALRFKIGEAIEKNGENSGKTRLKLYGQVIQSKSPEDVYKNYFVTGNYANDIVKIKDGSYYGILDHYPARNLQNAMESIMLMDQQLFMTDDVLAKVDRAAMAVSLETRVPFLDKDVVRFSWSLPIEYKYKDGITKRIVRDLLYDYVPKELVDLPKRGFGLPLNIWLKEGRLRDWADELLSKNNLSKYEWLDSDVIIKIWKQFTEKDYWNAKIWYILMYLEWERKINCGIER